MPKLVYWDIKAYDLRNTYRTVTVRVLADSAQNAFYAGLDALRDRKLITYRIAYLASEYGHYATSYTPSGIASLKGSPGTMYTA